MQSETQELLAALKQHKHFDEMVAYAIANPEELDPGMCCCGLAEAFGEVTMTAGCFGESEDVRNTLRAAHAKGFDVSVYQEAAEEAVKEKKAPAAPMAEQLSKQVELLARLLPLSDDYAAAIAEYRPAYQAATSEGGKSATIADLAFDFEMILVHDELIHRRCDELGCPEFDCMAFEQLAESKLAG